MKVVENVLLFVEHAVAMPLLTLVTASAQACNCPDATRRNPRQDGSGEPWLHRNTETAIPIQDGGSWSLRCFRRGDDEQSNRRAVNGLVRHQLRVHVGNVDRSGRSRVELHLAGAGVEGVDRRYLRVICVSEPDDRSTRGLLDGPGDGSGAW